MKIISPIAIDMGAKNTGVYLNHFEQGEDPTTSGNSHGRTIVIDGKKITWSQAARTQKRHQVRTGKRRKLAKRMLKLILKSVYDLRPERKQAEFLMGLLNRRGYTYLVEWLNEAEVNQRFVAEYFAEKHGAFFKSADTFFDDFLALSNDVGKSQKLLAELTLSKRESKKEVEDDKQSFADAYDNIKKVLIDQIKSEVDGHKYRAEYLKNIKADIRSSALLKPLFTGGFTAEKLTCLIGNISNLQLRVLRKYFNDAGMKAGDKWEPAKLHALFFRWVWSWHVKQAFHKENRKKLLELKTTDIVEVLTTSNPALTIPPYEDQNNRRPPKDLTLRLKPAGLDKNLKGWEGVVRGLIKRYCLPPVCKGGIESIIITEMLKDNARPQKIKGKSQETPERQELADALHRILDRTAKLDPYQLRRLRFAGNATDTQESRELLDKHSGGRAADVIELAKKYYEEVDTAKQGLWSDSADSLFFRCNTNPPHKNKIHHHLISHIVGEELDEKKLQKFLDECWRKKTGRSTIMGIAKRAEDERKKYGNRFKHLVERQVWLNDEPDRELETEKEHGVDGKRVLKTRNDCLAAADLIAGHFGHDDAKKKIYANVFSLAQLYNILETQIKGFSRTDRWNTIENAWRSRKDGRDENNEPVANAVRLTADSIRPFDGLLDRIISRQAREIAKMKIEQLQGLGVTQSDPVFVPIFMEQNRFQFEEGMADIKANQKKKTAAQKNMVSQEKRWNSKSERIKGASNLCPYTGEEITAGEIDHIIPQSQSKQGGDVVYNSEINLIYCSREGNFRKGAERYDFDRLNGGYLESVFGAADKEKIKADIRNFVGDLDRNNFVFHKLGEQEKEYLRHALFMRELDSKTFPLLNMRLKTMVNGTQGYLGKQLRKLLQNDYPQVEVKTYQVGAQEVSELRKSLGDAEPGFAKSDRQGAFSHVIDAALTMAAALQDRRISKELQTVDVSALDLSALGERSAWLKELLPAQADVQHIERKPKYRKDISSTQIFKEALYGERFLPILLDGSKVCMGFDMSNCAQIKIKQSAYFDALKPFLYFGSDKNMRAPTEDLDHWQQRAKESKRGYLYFPVNKGKALAHLQKCAKAPCADEEADQAGKLNMLRYCVEKKSIKSVLLKGDQSKTFISSLDEIKFGIATGIHLPAKADWDRLIAHPVKDRRGKSTTLKDYFGKKEQVLVADPAAANLWTDLHKESGLDVGFLKENLLKKNEQGELSQVPGIIPKGVLKAKARENQRLAPLEASAMLDKWLGKNLKIEEDHIPASSWKNLQESFFRAHRHNAGRHKSVRKVYSLPVVSAPSGGFRVKRENPMTKETVYQVSSVAGFATKGLDSSLKQEAPIDELQKSKNIAPVGALYQEPPASVVDFDEWREIDLSDSQLESKISSLRYAIGSKVRFHIRVQMPFQNFRKLDDSIGDWKEIPVELAKPANFTAYFASGLLGKPRSTLRVEKISAEYVAFSYIVESTKKEMKIAFTKAQS